MEITNSYRKDNTFLILILKNMKIKKYKNTPGRLPRPIAASDMTSHVAAIPLRQQRNDVEQQTLNTNRMRSFDTKERKAGQKAEVQRRKQKRQRVKQTANPHVDAATIQDNQSAINADDAAIEQQVAQEAERNNPYGTYRLNLNQGTLRGLSDNEWKESRGTLMNLADKLDGDNMFSRGLKRELTEMSQGKSFVNGLWNGFGQAGTAATIISNPWTVARYTLSGEGINYFPRMFGDRTLGDILADNTDWMTRGTGNTIVPLVGPQAVYHAPRLIPQRIRNGIYTTVTPFSYSFSAFKDGLRGLKLAFDPKWKFDPNELPERMRNISWSTTREELRDQAWRKALKVQQREGIPEIYKPNGDGTFSYDLDAIEKITGDKINISDKLSSRTLKPGESKVVYDFITGNGGNVKLTRTKNGDYIMEDLWDLQPFKRSPQSYDWPIHEKILNLANKLGLRDIEMLHLVGGKPFMLRYTMQ